MIINKDFSVIEKGNNFFVLKDFIDQMIKKSAMNGPNICILNEFSKSPCKAKQVDLVKKQVGQGTPVICLNGQEIPGKE